jgi:hypothetical protein
MYDLVFSNARPHETMDSVTKTEISETTDMAVD